MNIIVPVKLVPDLVEELSIDASGSAFDYDWLRYKLNELDEHAIEQGLLLKERYGGQVTVIALEDECTDEILFTAAAKGIDRLLKIASGSGRTVNNHTLVQLLFPVIRELHPDLILTGVQAHNDLDGPIGALLAETLGLPYIGYVSGISLDKGSAGIRKEFPGGLIAEMSVKIPVVLGIQSAEQPLRYIAYSKIRQAMKTTTIENIPAPNITPAPGVGVDRMFQPETSAKAEMIEGSPEIVANRLVELFEDLGLL